MKIKDLKIEYINARTDEVIHEDEGTFEILQRGFEIGWSANIGYGSYTVWVDEAGKVFVDDETLGEGFLELLLPLISEFFRTFAKKGNTSEAN